MNTTSSELAPIWNSLKSIFSNYTKYTSKVESDLQKLNIPVTRIKGNHAKLCFIVNGIKKYVTISCSPSDTYAGNQILRQIRRIYNES